jgi:uncharacterized protein
MISIDLLQKIIEQYPLKLGGIHGISHWARVLENGRRLLDGTGANPDVVELFAVFHDANRRNEGFDYEHGLRGANLAKELRGSFFELSDNDFELLYDACAHHTDGLTTGDISVITCWDADRLDLPRVPIPINPKRLCTNAARSAEVIAWADARSRIRLIPDLVYDEWGVSLDN